MRRLAITVVLAVLTSVSMVPSRVVRAEESAAQKTARKIADAREQVDAANQAYFEAEQELAQLATEQSQLAGEITDLEGQVATLESRVQQVALNRYTRSGGEGSPILDGFDSPEEQMQIDVLSQVIYDTSEGAFDEFDSANRDLVAKQRTLAYNQQQTEQQQQAMANARDNAAALVEKLQVIEAQQLKDEAVRKALAAEEARRAREVANSAKSGGSSGGSSGSRAGGKTGSGPLNPPQYPSSTGIDWSGHQWVCPTGNAQVGFGNSFVPQTPGGGYYHNGIDMIGKRGTPLVAVVDGVAQARTNGPGGNVVFFYGDDGVFYYYAHLEAWGTLGRVSKGTVVGYMGMTGHAGTWHLHFEMHPGGVGNPVNPYNKLRQYC